MKAAFSLVELSIVLVILGLLTGGILSGQSLIRAAEIRSVSTDIARYTTALHTFRDKYRALPGDMRNAVRFWGAQAGATTDGTDSTCTALTAAATGTATCNGNGDGMIGLHGASTDHERFRIWQHLANAGLVEGTYSGVRGSSSTDDPDIGTNVPASKISNAGFYLHYRSVHPDFFAGNYGHFFTIGGDTNNWTLGPFVKAEEMWNIDTKLDDGRPQYGNIRSRALSGGTTASCVTSSNITTAEYALSSTGNCGIIALPGI